jgi:PilZ domain
MKRAPVASGNGLQSVGGTVNRRQEPRPSVEFGLMYSAQEPSGEVLMGDGIVTDLSPTGLGIRGNASVTSGKELMIFLYLPDGQDPLFVMEARVAWASGRRFGVEILKMNLRERNRLRYFLRSNLTHSE